MNYSVFIIDIQNLNGFLYIMLFEMSLFPMKCTYFLFTNPRVLATWWLPLGCTVCPFVAVMFSTNSRMVNFAFKYSFSVDYLALRFTFLFFWCCMKDANCFSRKGKHKSI